MPYPVDTDSRNHRILQRSSGESDELIENDIYILRIVSGEDRLGDGLGTSEGWLTEILEYCVTGIVTRVVNGETGWKSVGIDAWEGRRPGERKSLFRRCDGVREGLVC